MARTKILAISVLVAAISGAAHASPDDRKAGALLQAADAKSTIEGDFKAAITLYQQAFAEAGSNGPVAARALLGLADAYRLTGAPAAQETYARIVRDFAEPKEIVAAARARLAAFVPHRQEVQRPSPRLTLGLDGATVMDVSADGNTAVTVMSGVYGVRSPELALRNLTTGESRTLVRPTAARANIGPARISPDTRSVAFIWNEVRDGKPVDTLSLVGTEPGAAPRVLIQGDLGSVAWSPDGRLLLVLRGTGDRPQRLDWVNVADGSARTIKIFEGWQRPWGFNISPDGWIAFARQARPESNDRHIYVMDSAGQSEVAVVNAAAVSVTPVWTPDGAHLIFGSNKSGTSAVWTIAMQSGHPSGEATLLISDRLQAIATTRSGGLFLTSSNMNEYNQVAFVGDLDAGSVRITKTFVGEGISWSPDGRSLAYIRNAFGALGVMIRSVDTGEERAYPNAGIGLAQARWLPDSSGVVVAVPKADDGGRTGAWYVLDLKSGEYRKLCPIAPGGSSIVSVSPDGKSLYATHKRNGTTEVLVIDLATGSQRQIAMFHDDSDANAGLSISPDGASLVVQTWADQSKRLGRLLIVRTDGTGSRDLLPSFPADRTLSVVRWMPDGRSILYFTTAPNGDWRLMRISSDGGQPEFAGLDSTRLTGTVRLPPSAPYSPLSMDVSPDGAHIVFAYRPNLHTDLWSVDNIASVIASRH